MVLPEERIEFRDAHDVEVRFVLPVDALYIIVPVLSLKENVVMKILLLDDVPYPQGLDAYAVVKVDPYAVPVLFRIF